ncbi:MAG: acyl carrier protein [Planctomycetota bacterium]|jgi:acyl carrier protein|nr:acyl carrier protein [Planctomycetota bacterium]MDP6764127.1 acyl carrier protein [Planctomycetota bacterium]MDP6989584.1 acyl carrier protein [Planctomycetota bacterium]
MTPDEIIITIKDIIHSINPDEELSAVDPQVPLRDQLDLDSMDFLDIVMELRKRYGVQVPEDEYPRLASLASCAEYLLPKLEDKELQAAV